MGRLMSVPAALSVPCELRRHDSCDGIALDLIHDEPTTCTCRCHTQPRRTA